jgi:type IV pilus assembly protein PilC
MLLKKINLARFARTFSVLLVTDIPIVESLRLTSGILGNVCYRSAVVEVSKEVEKGVPVSEVLQKTPNLFPPIVTQMIAVGEQTGTLDSILADITQFYEEDVERTVANLSSIIEPVLILILGVAVAGIAMAVVMPMYSLTQQM